MTDYDDDEDEVLDYLVRSGAISAEVAENARRRRHYEALSESRYADGKTVGGHYVKPSIGQNLATLGNQIAGAYGSYKADQRDAELQAQRADALQKLIDRAKRKKAKKADPYLGTSPYEGEY
jgi:hypothetical protein